MRSRVRISPLLIKKRQVNLVSFLLSVEFDEYSIKSSSDLRAEAGVLLTSDKITKSKHGIAV